MPKDHIPSYGDILQLPYYDKTDPRLIGRPYLMGQDDQGNFVYFMGLWYPRKKLIQTLRTLLDMAGVKDDEYLLQDVLPLINFSTKFGGFLSKRFYIPTVGCRLSIWGIQRRYFEFVDLVEKVKKRLE